MNCIIHKSYNHIYNHIKHYYVIHTIGQRNKHMFLSYGWSKLTIINMVKLVNIVGTNIDPWISLSWSKAFAINLPHHVYHNVVT